MLNAAQIRDEKYAECIKILRNALLHHSQVSTQSVCLSLKL